MSAYGDIVIVSDVDRAVIDTLKAWMPAYVSEVARQKGIAPAPPTPRSYSASPDLTRQLEEQLPAVVVISPGLGDEPSPRGDGKVDAGWEVAVVIIAQGRTAAESRVLAGLYAGSARAALLQHPSLGGLSSGVTLIDEGYDDLSDKSRSLAAGKVVVRVDVDGIVDRHAGVSAPPLDPSVPPADRPTVATHTETEIPKRPGEEL